MAHVARRDFLRAGAAVTLGLEAARTQLAGSPAGDEPELFEGLAGYRLQETVESKPLAIVPCGSLEYHGPHNPFGTDSIIISGIAGTSPVAPARFSFPP